MEGTSFLESYASSRSKRLGVPADLYASLYRNFGAKADETYLHFRNLGLDCDTIARSLEKARALCLLAKGTEADLSERLQILFAEMTAQRFIEEDLNKVFSYSSSEMMSGR